jgi:hypothetical protein
LAIISASVNASNEHLPKKNQTVHFCTAANCEVPYSAPARLKAHEWRRIMKMARQLGILLLIAIGVYLCGYWPTKRRLDKASDQLRQTSAQLSAAQEKIGIYSLQNVLLKLLASVSKNDFDQAQPLSSKFFDGVSDEINRTGQPAIKRALESILAKRDIVTFGIARKDPGTVDLVRKISEDFTQVAGNL